MSHISILLLSAVLLLAAAPARADAHLPATLSSPSPGTWRMDWDARPGMTYFVQWSEDLENWNWYPVAIRGNGPMFFEDAPTDTAGHSLKRFFFRLLGIDANNPPPWLPDSDGDGLPDDLETDAFGTDPDNPDSDGDGLTDFEELAYTLTDPNSADSDGDGIPDPQDDEDGDGLGNATEINIGTHPMDTDSDDDGIPDGQEDADGDNLGNLQEILEGTDPLEADTDGDGMCDGDEFDIGLDPLDGQDVGPLVENDPNAPVAPTAPGIVFLPVTGNNDPEAGEPPVHKQKTETNALAADTDYLVVAALESEEFPEYTRVSSEWNDTVQWTLAAGGETIDSGSNHVNAHHRQWLGAVVRGSELFGLRPVHYLHLGILKARPGPRTAFLSGTVGNVSDGNLPTTLILAFVPVKIAPAPGTAQTLGDMVPSNKRGQAADYRFHFVTPKKSQWLPGGFAEFNVESPPRDIFDQLLRWAPDSAGEPLPSDPDNPLRRRVSRAAPGKFPLKLETNPEKIGLPAAEATVLDAWVVWAEGTIRNYGNFVFDSLSGNLRKTIGGADTGYVTWHPPNTMAANLFQFEFTIQPKKIITDLNAGNDAPDLDGDKTQQPEVPGSGMTHPVLETYANGNPTNLANGAKYKWDVSRQMQIRIKNPDSIPHDDFLSGFNSLYDGQPKNDSTPVAFPGNPVVGNDDVFPEWKNNNPYQQFAEPGHEPLHHDIGSITSADGPFSVMSSISAAPGRTYEETDSFREFARLQLPSGWFRISENLEWNIALKIKCDQNSNQWTDDGSAATKP